MYLDDVLNMIVCIFLLFLPLPSCCSPVTVAIGQRATLPCYVDIGGNINVEWIDPSGTILTYNAEVLSQDKRIAIRHPYLKEWNLEISNVRRDDAGNYTCRIGPIPDISTHVELRISTPPEITATSGSGKYVIQSDVTLTCTAKGTPEPTITWYYLDDAGKRNALNVEGNVYSIKSISWMSAGDYQCHASNGVSPLATSSIKVDVLFAPEIKVPYCEIIQEEGKWTQLTCLITANPPADIFWLRNNQRIENLQDYQVQTESLGGYEVVSRLSINILSPSHYGNYKCVAVNDYDRDEGEISLQGQESDRALVIVPPKDSIVVIGNDIQLNCSILNLPSEHKLRWWYGSENGEMRKLFTLPPSDTDVIDVVKYAIKGEYNLLIKQTNISDQGLYTCEITGHKNYSVRLNVVDIWDPSAICEKEEQMNPSLVTALSICIGVLCLVLLLVIIIVVIVFQIQLKRNRESNFNPVELTPKLVKLRDANGDPVVGLQS